MTRRYGVLFAVILAIAVVLARVKAPHGATGGGGTAALAAPAETVALVVTDGTVTPAQASAHKGSRVRLIVKNRGSAPMQLALAGYEGRLVVPRLEPGVAWSGSFTAELPGDDFAWLVDGKPAARFAVTGSHLEDGHR
jgi:cupredoxin-like protein